MSNFVKQSDGSYTGDSSICIGDIAGKVVDDYQIVNIPVSGVKECEDYLTEYDCPESCYWYDDACHSKPKVPPVEIPWVMIAAAGAVVVTVIVAIFIARR